MFQRIHLLALILSLAAVGCAGPKASDSAGTGNALFGPIGSEKSFCSAVSSPSPATTITSTAQYKYWVVNRSFGLTTTSTAPIRYAEVEIVDSSGSRIQCGTTDSSGSISIAMPRAAGNYTLKVYSRVDNNVARASVLNNSTAMLPYSISVDFTLAGNEATKAVTLTAAPYNGTLEGGAFNILDQIIKAEEFLANNSACSFCTTFSVNSSSPKLRIFWTPGLSPGAYYQSPTSSISFYIGDDEASLGMASGMYLMGGVNGDTCVDTDHFDNSVIVHEFGHFLEKAYAYSNSPGGSHNGNAIIDPRLAWSEGWSNFLQGAVRADSHYVDTKGNADCSGGTGINVDLDLENMQVGQDKMSALTYLGEGIFREVSVSRVLWDTIDSNIGGDTYGANVNFPYIWKVFSDPSSGFASPAVHFRNVGQFNEIMRTLINANSPSNLTNYDNLVANERQRSDRREYAYTVTPQTSGSWGPPNCEFDLDGVSTTNNYAKTNDFFAYYYDGSASHATVNLKYSASSGTPTDLDLLIWNEDYAFGDSSTLAGSSTRYYPESGGAGVETVNLSGKPAGYYLIQIMADPDNVNNTAHYYLETNGGSEHLCH